MIIQSPDEPLGIRIVYLFPCKSARLWDLGAALAGSGDNTQDFDTS
jgi:hypothetical protein